MTYNNSALTPGASKQGLYSRSPRTTTGAIVLSAFGLTSLLYAEEPDLEILPELSVIANRTETNLEKVGSAVTILDTTQLEREGITHLDDALKFTPGVISESLGGQRGSVSSLFLRGSTTQHAHIRVDGMRISGPNITTNNFLGSSNLSGISRIEVLRGPQSALYGGDAIGGGIGLYSQKGSGDPSFLQKVEFGSHDSATGSISSQGQFDQLSYSFSAGYLTTENDLPNNDFEQGNYSLRLDFDVSDNFTIGATLRAIDSDFRRPSYSDPNFARAADDETESVLATLFAELQVNDIWSTKLTLGYYDEEYDSQTFASSNSFKTDGTKKAVYWDNTIAWTDSHTTSTGLLYERTNYDYESVFFGITSDRRESDQYGIYINHGWDITDTLTLTGGIRWEDYDTYGDEFTWRGAVAYRIPQTNTKLRASVGKGFRPPSATELYGFGGGSNFDLEAEQSIGWDLGIDQEFADGKYAIGLTYFENHIEDLISSIWDPSTFTSTYFNTPGTSLTNGFELEAHGQFLQDRLQTSLTYTYLNKSLKGQPEHSATLRVNGDITDDLSAGFNVQYLDQRTFGADSLDSYAIVNLHARYDVTENVAFTARVENLFDKDYEHFAGFGETYPGRGRGVFGGVTLQW